MPISSDYLCSFINSVSPNAPHCSRWLRGMYSCTNPGTNP